MKKTTGRKKKSSSKLKFLMRIDRTEVVTFDDVQHLLFGGKLKIVFVSVLFDNFFDLTDRDQKLLLTYLARCFPTMDLDFGYMK